MKQEDLPEAGPLSSSLGVGWGLSGGESAGLAGVSVLAADGIENIISGWGSVEGTSIRQEESDETQEKTVVVAVKLNLCLLALDQERAVQFYDKTEDMEIKIPLHDLQEQMKLIFFPQVSVQSFDYNRNGENLQVRCEVMVHGCLAGLKRCCVMGDIEVDQTKPVEREDDCSLTIYYADAAHLSL